ncbi:MAG TPA: M20/M25/M40 family metallo-hydrolase [Pyrinomonadaceae bacterium]|nr:M20/M25/M40 family metallo-hydrolase [Pyrinomonadaceae bacterium]
MKRISTSNSADTRLADLGVSAAACLFLAAVVFATLYQQRPPAALSAGAPLTEFASGRAMEHLKVIAARPHPIGSTAAVEVRNYIVDELKKLNLEPEVQTATAAVSTRAGGASAATVRNILGRLKGQDPTAKAVMLAAHYDSVPNGNGASDDGSGVVVLLETMRALKAGPPLKNDIVCLFDDGEEIGLMGARAFVDEHPWAGNIGLVLNFEARGASGPVFMFETSEQNGWLINEYAKAVPHPFSTSLMYSIYKLLPNDTDLTVFKRAGLAGLNFAYIDDAIRYHSQRDNLQEIDERSVQHGGSYALALARHFGNLSLENRQAANVLYFDIWGSTLITYSAKWVKPFAILALVLFMFVVYLGRRKKQLTIKGMLLGFASFILSLVVIDVAVWLLWGLLTTLHNDYSPLTNANLYIVSFVALAVALASALYLFLNRWITFHNLTLGALFGWLLLTVLLSLYLPEASYLMLWPLVFSLLALGLVFFRGRESSSRYFSPIVLCLGSVPGIILMTGTTQNLFQGLNLGMLLLIIGMCLLLLGLLIPYLEFIARGYKWALPMTAALVSVIFLVIGNAVPAFSNDAPRADTVFYSVCYSPDTNTQEALWVSPNRTPDEWSAQFFSSMPERKLLPNHFPTNTKPFLSSRAPDLNLKPDEVKVIDSKTRDDLRALHLKISSPQQARVVVMFLELGAEVVSATINGKRIDYDKPKVIEGAQARPWELRYDAIPIEGIDLVLETRTPWPVKMTLVSQSDGFPQIPGTAFKERPANLIPSPNSDITRLIKSFRLDRGELLKSATTPAVPVRRLQHSQRPLPRKS